MIARSEPWQRRAVNDFASQRRGRSELRCVVAEDGDGVRGYARYTTKPSWDQTGPGGLVDVREILALDTSAQAELYRYLFDLDLMTTCELWNVPVDDPLLQWLTDPRGARPVWLDSLYARVVDLPVALVARGYSSPVDLVIDVDDPLLPGNTGRWRLLGGPGRAHCEPTDAAADLSMGVAELSAVYLGGTELAALAAAGRVEEHSPGAVASASQAFLNNPKPWSPAVF
jgi:predicted acetyltransferase